MNHSLSCTVDVGHLLIMISMVFKSMCNLPSCTLILGKEG